MVVVFFIPTFLLSVDFVIVTLYRCSFDILNMRCSIGTGCSVRKHGLVDHAHYCASLFWLISASSWVSSNADLLVP